MSYHPSTTRIIDLLKANDCWYETFEHQPVRTSEQAAQVRDGYSLAQGAKALIVRVKLSKSNRKFVMLVLPGDKRFNRSKVEAFFQAKDIRFANSKEIEKITQGVKPGGIPPMGHLFNLEVIVDPLLLAKEKMIFNAGDKSFSVGMKTEDYLNIVKPAVVEIT